MNESPIRWSWPIVKGHQEMVFKAYQLLLQLNDYISAPLGDLNKTLDPKLMILVSPISDESLEYYLRTEVMLSLSRLIHFGPPLPGAYRERMTSLFGDNFKSYRDLSAMNLRKGIGLEG